jgi:3-methylcrotonyl-CoA carboxylase alpha subunit
MKMEHTVVAPAAGKVERILCAVGEQVKEGVELLELKP